MARLRCNAWAGFQKPGGWLGRVVTPGQVFKSQVGGSAAL